MVSNIECTMDFCHLRHKSNQPTNQKKLHVCLLKPKDSEAVEKLEKQDICNFVGLKTTDCFCCVQWGVNCYVWYSIMIDEATSISRNKQMCLCVQ